LNHGGVKVVSNVHTGPLIIKTFSTKEITSIIKSLNQINKYSENDLLFLLPLCNDL